MKSKTDRFKQKKTYSTPDIKELEVEKLRHQWDFEVFGVVTPETGTMQCPCEHPGGSGG